jgi:hypothetical protein
MSDIPVSYFILFVIWGTIFYCKVTRKLPDEFNWILQRMKLTFRRFLSEFFRFPTVNHRFIIAPILLSPSGDYAIVSVVNHVIKPSVLLFWFSFCSLDHLCGLVVRLHNGDVLCFLWGTNWIYIYYVEQSRPLCGLVVRVPGYKTEMYCAFCEVRTEFIYVM